MNRASVERHRAYFRAALLLALLIALLAISRGVAAAPGSCEARAAHAHRSVAGASLANWEPVDARTVLIWTTHSPRAYLVRLDRPLAGLDSAEMIDLIDGDGDRRISPCGHDAIALGAADGGGAAVRIASIRSLSAKRTAELDRGARLPSPASSRA